MKIQNKIFHTVVIALSAFSVFAQDYSVRIGYVYPAGGQRGTSFSVVIGGQNIRGASNVVITGGGVTVTNVRAMKTMGNLNAEQRYILVETLLSNVRKDLEGRGLPAEDMEKFNKHIANAHPWNILKKTDLNLDGETLPDHPLFIGIDKMSLRELIHVKEISSIAGDKLQKNRQIADPVVLDVVIDTDAPVGERELRLQTKTGMSNPLVFEVGTSKEVKELEPNDTESYQIPWEMKDVKVAMAGSPYQIPCTFNGQIMPGDVDRFRFTADKGQNVLIEVDARRLIPYLADAVPGWFQAVIAVYDSAGKELAYADDHYINPDPVMSFSVPADGEYEVEIRDSIYRGREDFVYRINISDNPELLKELADGSKYGDRWTRKAVMPLSMDMTHIVPPDVAALPSASDNGNNDTIGRAQSVHLPSLIDGGISTAGDVDVYKVNVDSKQTIAVEVYARRLGSPVDSYIKVTDKEGKVIASNDDYMVKEKHLYVDLQGLVTHHADSQLLVDLPEEGAYFIHVSDMQGHGGSRYGYRLRVSQPMPGFILRATPSVMIGRQNDCMPVHIYALRRDGYQGPIRLKVMGQDRDFSVSGADMPAESLSCVATLQALAKGTGDPIEISMIGTAEIEGKTISVPVIPAERVMQAFLYEHLLPVTSMTCTVRKEKWGAPAVARIGDERIALRSGESATLRYEMSWNPGDTEFDLVLEDAPDGLEIDKTPRRDGKKFEFDVKAGKDMKAGERNILVSLWGSKMVKPEGGEQAKLNRWRVRLLPAIPIRVSEVVVPAVSSL